MLIEVVPKALRKRFQASMDSTNGNEKNNHTAAKTFERRAGGRSRENRKTEIRNPSTGTPKPSRGVKQMGRYHDIVQDELEQLEKQKENSEAANEAAQA